MRNKDLLTLFAIFAIIVGASSVSVAMATPMIEPNSAGKFALDCADLSEDLQFLVENGIITARDARDALFVFYCGL